MDQIEMLSHLEEIKEWEERKTSPSTVILTAILLSIPLGFCCYFLLQ